MAGIPGGKALHGLVHAVLTHAMSTLGEGEELKPLLVEETGTGERTIRRFTAPSTEAGVKAARKAASASRAERVTVCWRGMVRARGEQHHAVYAVAQERGQAHAHVFVQRISAPGEPLETLGNPGYMGENEALLA
ncbi:hypothetical protein [Demequina pelophila]|uniref:hypothetical protein n=1 Tax=Demequina pelophila TaxID=1638984 RepID=UPI000786737D|nr:hypothetical protein [Demequina pelophila]